ncbi:hypothetical protein JCM8097_000394 [Rhodosporidiobolus ruineniae]
MFRNRMLRYVFIAAVSVVALFVMTAGFLYHFGNINAIQPWNWSLSLAVAMWSNAKVDIAISVALACTLRQRIAGFSTKTDSLLVKLITTALQTASYTTILSIVGAATAAACGDWNPHYLFLNYAFWLPLPACYGVSLYTTLNVRRRTEDDLGGPLTTVAATNSPAFRRCQCGGARPPAQDSYAATLSQRSAGRVEMQQVRRDSEGRLAGEGWPMLTSVSSKDGSFRRSSAEEFV